MTSIPEPDHTWIVVDHDGYFWRWDVDEWKCLSAAGNESWHVLVEVFGPLQVYAPATQTDDGAAVAGPTLRPAVSPPAPSSPIPRRFQMYRHHDVSGVSGTGLIAEGTEYRDGVVSLRWYGEHPSEVWWPSVDEILAVHGHQGATEIRWIDEPPIDYWPTEGATR